MRPERSFASVRRRTACAVCLTWFTAPFARAEEIVGTAKGKVYHTHDCKAAQKINEENKITFASVQEAEDAGRRLCSFCARIDESGEEPADDDSKGKKGKNGRTGEKRSNEGSGKKDVPKEADKPPPGLPTEAKIKDVLPGGTLVLDNGEHAALLGAVCPCRGQPHDRKSARAIEKLLADRTVQLAYDPHQAPWEHRDELGRLRVYVKLDAEQPDAAAALIAEGDAWLDRSVEIDRRSKYDALEGQAWGLRRGIWTQLEGEAGKRKVLVGKHAPHYHALDCPHRAHLIDAEPITINDALLRRLTPCALFEEDEAED